MTTVAELNAVMTMNAGQFMTGVGGASKTLDVFEAKATSVSRTMSSIGSTMTKNVTLPLAAVGAGALAVGLDFNQSFTNISALVGVADKDLAKMRESTLAMSSAVGKGPQELGDALYFVTSAGLSGERAMSALEESAKASAAGLGETAVVADAVTSAMAAYETQGLSAANATDVLVAAVREGKVEPDAMAASLGKVLPMASAMGVEFHEVAGAIAVMSRTGLDAAESTTALRGIMSAILKPTDQAKDALAGVGLSAEGLRSMLAEQGLLPTLQVLQQKFEGNSEAMSTVFGDVRGLTGVLNILGQDSAAVAGVMDEVKNSTGDAGEAFRKTAESDGFKMKQALADIQVSLVKVSDTILPFVANVAGGAAKVASAFGSMPGPVQQTVIAFAGVAAISGPMLSLFGKIGSGLSALAPLFPTVAAGADKVRNSTAAGTLAAGGFAKNLAAVGGAAAAGAAVWMAWTAMIDSAREAGKKMATEALEPLEKKLGAGEMSMADINKELERTANATTMLDAAVKESSAPWDADYRAQLEAAKTPYNEIHDKMQAIASMAGVLSENTGESADVFAKWLSTVDGGPDKFKTTEEALTAFKVSQVEATGVTHENATALAALGDQYLDQALATDKAKDSLKDWTDAVNAQFDPLFGMLDAMNGLQDQNLAVTEATTALTTARREHGYMSVEAQKAAVELQRAQEGLLKSNVDLDVASRTLTSSVANGTTKIDEAKAAVDGWVAAGRLSAAQAETIKKRLDEVAYSAMVADAQNVLIPVQADTTQYYAAIRGLEAARTNAEYFKQVDEVRKFFEGGGSIPAHASGGLFTKPHVGMVAEAGPELILPLSNPARSRELLAQSGLGGSGGGGNTYNVTVNPPAGMSRSEGRRMAADTVEAIRQYEKERAT